MGLDSFQNFFYTYYFSKIAFSRTNLKKKKVRYFKKNPEFTRLKFGTFLLPRMKIFFTRSNFFLF